VSGFRTAITFLTRIPIGDGRKPNVESAPAWFPIVGLLIGAACGGVFAGGSWLVGPLPGAALAIGFGALVTGAFHQDGLADTADAFGGGWTVEQRLEIFKDSRHGTYGVMSLVIVVALQITALSTLGMRAGLMALAAAHGLGRCGAVLVMVLLPSARTEGLGASLGAHLSKRRVAASTGLVMILVIGADSDDFGGIVVLAAGVIALMITAGLSMRKIRGVVGDVLGAAEQIVETTVLLTAAALAAHGHPWHGIIGR
jgi:adenosylcobinamide-GDP ribazoletransferase